MKKQQLSTIQLFDLKNTMASQLLQNHVFPWEAIAELHDFIIYLGSQLSEEEYYKAGNNIWIGQGVEIAKNVAIKGPAIIGKNVKIQQFTCLSGNVIIGDNAVIGSNVELNNCILFNEARVAHSGYVEDSILGYRVCLAAGTVICGENYDDKGVVIHAEDDEIAVDLQKIGGILGDYVVVKANSVLNAATVIGKNAVIPPLSNIKGVIAGK